MSRNKRRKPRSRTKPEDIRISGGMDPQVVRAWMDLQRLLEENGPKDAEVFTLLNTNPKLTSYLNNVRLREEARELAMLPEVSKTAPTGATPQVNGLPSAWTGTRNSPLGVPNTRVLRNLADTDPWVRAAITARRQQIGRADIAVVPLNERKPYNKRLMKALQHLLDQPNELRDSYRSLIEPVLEDILVLDRGVISKDMTPDRKPVALYYEDGSTIKIYPQWSGNPKEPRYLYESTDGITKIPLRNDEAIVIMANPASYRYGLSPVQVLYETIRADLKASEAAMHMVDMKPPPHAIQIPGATEQQLRQLRTMYDTEIAGRKEIFWFGGAQAAKEFPLVFSAKDNQWLEWQIYLLRKIAAVFQLSPQQLGVTFDINKATAQVQQEIFEDTGLIPLLLLLEEFLNRELLADFAPKLPMDRVDLDAVNLRIIYPEVSEAARQMHAERAIEMASKGMRNIPSMTPNQALMMRGEQPVKGGNTFYFATSAGPIPMLSYDNDYGDYGPRSTGGTLGSQDAVSGPDAEESSPNDESSGRDMSQMPQIQPDGPTSQLTPPQDAGPTTSAPGAGLSPAKAWDNRPPGKRWSVAYIK